MGTRPIAKRIAAATITTASVVQTGTTRIGRYVLNHSFMLPGLIAVTSAVLIGLLVGGIAS